MSYQQGEGATHEAIRSLMKRRIWWSPMDLQNAYEAKTGKRLTDATLTRRMREMEDVACMWDKKKKRHEYRLAKTQSKAA